MGGGLTTPPSVSCFASGRCGPVLSMCAARGWFRSPQVAWRFTSSQPATSWAGRSSCAHRTVCSHRPHAPTTPATGTDPGNVTMNARARRDRACAAKRRITPHLAATRREQPPTRPTQPQMRDAAGGEHRTRTPRHNQTQHEQHDTTHVTTQHGAERRPSEARSERPTADQPTKRAAKPRATGGQGEGRERALLLWVLAPLVARCLNGSRCRAPDALSRAVVERSSERLPPVLLDVGAPRYVLQHEPTPPSCCRSDRCRSLPVHRVLRTVCLGRGEHAGPDGHPVADTDD